MSAEKLTPAQQQYMNIKQNYQDCLVFFRMGDFYELFYDDAKTAHHVLDITLTARDKDGPRPIPMAGIPYHALDKYLPKLMQAWYKVAIAEQIGEAVPGRVVQREVVSVMTPGTYVEQSSEVVLLLAVWRWGIQWQYHIAWGDISLGTYMTKTLSTFQELTEHIRSMNIREVVLSTDIPEKNIIYDYIHWQLHISLSRQEPPRDVDNFLYHILQINSLWWYGDALTDGRRYAAAVLFSYIMAVQKYALQNIHRISYDLAPGNVFLDATTIKNLELFASSYHSQKKYSLYAVINCTHTAMWSRLLADRLIRPINVLEELDRRLSYINHYTQAVQESDTVCLVLRTLPDIPRLISFLLWKKSSALKRCQLRSAVKTISQTAEIIQGMQRVWLSVDTQTSLLSRHDRLQTVLQEEVRDERSNYIADWYNTEIDELRRLAYHADDLLLQYQQELVWQTGVTNIKIKYIQNQWYVVEVTPKDIAVFEAARREDDPKFNLTRRQTLKWWERYTSSYLLGLEEKILQAMAALEQKEAFHLQELQHTLIKDYGIFAEISDAIAELDLSTSMAGFAKKHNRTKPVFTSDSSLNIEEGRHPVIEHFLPHDQQFVPNDLHMKQEELVHIVTWPNMWGKSTFLRQQALIVLLAHIGLYVPAVKAHVGLVDGIFARVGSGDMLAQHQSTFMTEMLEVAHILHHATPRSFIILDELGRGTSTYDGMALAKSIIVYLCQKVKAKCLFATHYHELIELAQEFEAVKNFSVSVYETDTDVVFLKKIISWWASKSYGIDVAKLAWLPADIIIQSKVYLKELEQLKSSFSDAHASSRQQQISLELDFSTGAQDVNPLREECRDILQHLDTDHLSPIDALIKLVELKRRFGV